MIEPREAFRKGAHGKSWQDVVDSERFHAAVTAALTQMQMDLSSPPDMATAASYQFRMEGAKQFLQKLMALSLTGPPQPKTAPLNLNHL